MAALQRLLADTGGTPGDLAFLASADPVSLRPGVDYFLVGGRAVLLRDGRYDRLVTPGDHLYVPDETLWRQIGEGAPPMNPSWRLQPLPEVELRVLSPRRRASLAGEDHPALARLRTDWADAELHHVREARRRLTQGLTDFIDEEGALGAGPYELNDARLVLAVAEDALIHTLVPTELRSRLFNHRFLVAFADYPGLEGTMVDGRKARIQYRETSVFVPVMGLTAGGPGLFCPELYPDNMMAIVVGRELYGFPKLHADTYIEPLPRDGEDLVTVLNGEVACHLRVDRWSEPHPGEWSSQLAQQLLGDDLDAAAGATLARALVGDARDLADWVEHLGDIPIVLRRRIRRAGGEIDELIRAPFKVSDVNELRVGDASQFQMSLGRLSGARLRGVFSCRLDMGLSAPERLLDRSASRTRRAAQSARGLARLAVEHAPILGAVPGWVWRRR